MGILDLVQQIWRLSQPVQFEAKAQPGVLKKVTLMKKLDSLTDTLKRTKD